MTKTETQLVSQKKVDITIARGDGIGPEIMDATLRILNAAGAEINVHEIEIGEKTNLLLYEQDPE